MFNLCPAEKLALFGGILISISTSFNLLVNNRITGMSGLYSGLLCFEKDFYYRAVFIFTMVATTPIIFFLSGFGEIYGLKAFDKPSDLVSNLNQTGYFLAGLLVGLGTVLGNGCTSGHGVCGLPRLSLRSWVYVPVFLVVAIIVATFRSNYPFLVEEKRVEIGEVTAQSYNEIMMIVLVICLIVVSLCFLYVLIINDFKKIVEVLTAIIAAAIFALGLIVSGMNKRQKILGFLTIDSNWDPSLLIVLCGAVGLNFLTFNVIRLIKKQSLPTGKVDFRLLLGAILFGLGWGIGGLCPGPGFVLFPFLTPHISFAWFGGLTVGQYLVKGFDKIGEMMKGKKIKLH